MWAAVSLQLFSCTGWQNGDQTTAAKAPAFQSKVIHKSLTDSSWGYIIEINRQQLIQQFTIPGLEGNHAFTSKQQAGLVGNLVALKLNNGRHPSVSKKELDSLGIIQRTHAIQKK